MNFKTVKVPCRLLIALMIFTSACINYMMRVNLSVILVAMVPTANTTQPPEGVTTFAWTAQEQAFILSGYFWGYTISSLVGGTVAEIWGPSRVIFLTTFVSAVLTILSPQAARLHYIVLVTLRVIMGFAGGFLFPSTQAIIAHWAPPDERSRFLSAMLGGSIGTVVTWSFTGPVIEWMGWEWAFYLAGITAALWCVLWWFVVYDSPMQHPRISDDEKQYILDAIGDKVHQNFKETKIVPPFRKILTSFPFLAMVILLYGSSWGLYFLLTAAPKFVSSVLGFNLTSTGSLASLPYLARMIFSYIFGTIGDRLVKQNKIPIIFIRKFFCLFSHVIPGLLLIALGYIGYTPMLAVTLITFSLGFNGASTITQLVNHQDLAPNFAGTLFGIANGIGTTAGFITPFVTAYFTKNGNGLAEWRPVFFTGGSMYIVTAVYFVIFGTAKIQPWNNIPQLEEKDKTSRTTVSDPISSKT